MTFSREWTVNAVRKPGQCEVCRQPIPVGSTAVRWAGMSDGDFFHLAWHLECRAAEIAYNKMVGPEYDEWYSLARDLEHDDRFWLIAEHPLVAQRMGIAS